jgi:hypothetical protein
LLLRIKVALPTGDSSLLPEEMPTETGKRNGRACNPRMVVIGCVAVKGIVWRPIDAACSLQEKVT